MQPTLRFRPLQPVVASNAATELDLLITITPPAAAADPLRQSQSLNLALAIDRSGSMSGSKLSYARKAARHLASRLGRHDRLAIVVFDDDTDVLMPSSPVHHPDPFIRAINTIHSHGCTNLHDGWIGAARQVAQHLDNRSLNRVLLLSDGHANRGLLNTAEIADQVAGLAERGVSTSAFGLGNGFDEDLMGSIAEGGQGTLAFIESPQDLPRLFDDELKGLNRTVGSQVRLQLEPAVGLEIVDVLNDLQRDSAGALKLPALCSGRPVDVAVRLRLPAWSDNTPLLQATLRWQRSGDGAAATEQIRDSLRMPAVPQLQQMQAEEDGAVAEQFAMMQSTRARQLAIDCLDRDDWHEAHRSLDNMERELKAMPMSPEILSELESITQRKREIGHRDRNRSRKALRSDSYRSRADVWNRH